MAQSTGQIAFYEGRAFTGRALELRGPCESLAARGLPARVGSVRVRSGAWLCFARGAFRGCQRVLERGDYPAWSGRGDQLGSCRPLAMRGEHYRIEIFEGNHFSGRSLELTEDCSFLQGQGWDKGYVNAIRVYGDGAWVLYEKPSYQGRMYVVERGQFGSCQEWQAQRPDVQSIRRVVNYF
ncbi:gamma-crystallin N [Eudromia elegans]